jgi:hypothetical protein
VTWAAFGLPAGLKISSLTGDISGTIGNSVAAAGPHTITITATDGTYSNSQFITWDVLAPQFALTTLAASSETLPIPADTSTHLYVGGLGGITATSGTYRLLVGNFGRDMRVAVAEMLDTMIASPQENTMYRFASIRSLIRTLRLRVAVLRAAYRLEVLMGRNPKRFSFAPGPTSEDGVVTQVFAEISRGKTSGTPNWDYVTSRIRDPKESQLEALASVRVVGIQLRDTTQWGIRDGVQKDVFGYSSPYTLSLDCTSAAVLVVLEALSTTFLTDSLKNKPIQVAGAFGVADTILTGNFSLKDAVTGKAPRLDLIPGDLRTFYTPDATSPAYRFETAIYLGMSGGARKYFAYPFGVVSEKTLIGLLNNKSKSKKTRGDLGVSRRPVDLIGTNVP